MSETFQASPVSGGLLLLAAMLLCCHEISLRAETLISQLPRKNQFTDSELDVIKLKENNPIFSLTLP
jgi:hypothetical protein